MSALWSWVLCAFGVAGLLLAGRGLWWGWVVNLVAQAAWLAYGLLTGQGGFVVSACLYAAVYAHNARAARARGSAPQRARTVPSAHWAARARKTHRARVMRARGGA